MLYRTSHWLDGTVPMHIEVLLPAFVLGSILARPPGSDPHRDDTVEGSQMGPESPGEQPVATLIAAVFMFLVGLSLPPFAAESADTAIAALHGVSAAQPPLPWEVMAGHVVALTVPANLGKMVPAFAYRHVAPWRGGSGDAHRQPRLRTRRANDQHRHVVAGPQPRTYRHVHRAGQVAGRWAERPS